MLHHDKSAQESDVRYQAALGWLMGRIDYERSGGVPYHRRQLKLDRMRQLLTRCGNPDAGMKIVHVAGTKGKGSTSALIAAVLQAAGYRVGVFSSPHLERIEERFAVDGQRCTTAELVGLVDRLRPVTQAMDQLASAEGDQDLGPTYFELTTAMALQLFADRQVDVAILEVGLGGRLDATNVCLPVVSVITSISYDHTRQLGKTLAEIAGEKAGIIKPGVPVISGVVQDEPRAVIADIAREHGCRLVELERDFHVQYEAPSADGQNPRRISYHETAHGNRYGLASAPLGLAGSHQAANAAVAIATLVELRRQGWSVADQSLRQGLATARLPARIELAPGRPATIIDTAHNPASAQALVDTLRQEFHAPGTTLLVSVSRDKDVRAILACFATYFDRFIVTQYRENPRAVPAARLAERLGRHLLSAGRGGIPVEVVPHPRDAWRRAVETTSGDARVVISGSFFLAAELRPLVLNPLAAEAPPLVGS